jgi:phosphatidylinositol glycan class K
MRDVNVGLLVCHQLKVCPWHQCHSTVAVRTDLFPRDPNMVLVTEFFGSVRNVELTESYIRFDENYTSSCR